MVTILVSTNLLGGLFAKSLADLICPNGLSCSMPEELQEPMMRAVPGLENVRMVKAAYGIEYDHIDPQELQRESVLSCVLIHFLIVYSIAGD